MTQKNNTFINMKQTIVDNFLSTLEEIRDIKQKILFNDNIKDKLCYCNKIFLTNFFLTTESVIILILSRTILKLYTRVEDDTEVKKVLEPFISLKFGFLQKSNYNSLLLYQKISKRYVLFLREIMKNIDTKFYNNLKQTLEILDDYIENTNDISIIDNTKLLEVIDSILQIFIDYIDSLVFVLYGLQINCCNISETIFETFPDSSRIKEKDFCGIDTDLCYVRIRGVERISILILPSLFSKSEMEYILSCIYKYHSNPKNIELLLDFRMVSTLGEPCKKDLKELATSIKANLKDLVAVNCSSDLKTFCDETNISIQTTKDY